MSEHPELIAQFRDVTGIDEDRARSYLESSGWQLEIALASFFENDNVLDEDGVEPAGGLQDYASAADHDNDDAGDPIRPKKLNAHKIIDLSGSESDSDDEGQAFYVGGSERSGQQVLGPPRHKGKGEKSGDIIGDMFKHAREHGAEVVDEKGGPSTKRKQAFKGTGYRLGQSEADTQIVPGAREPEPPRNVTLKLWKTGFSVDEGPVRDYQNPVNKDFLECIKRGEVPPEIVRESRGRVVHLQMEDHRTEEFISKKTRFQAFVGQGQVLGNPAPSVVTSAASNAASASLDPAASEQKAVSELNINSSEPVTSVQIRLADGSRLIARFNHTNTIGQLRQYIATARPQYGSQSFSLLTTYPSRELSDESLTLKDASLLNATVMQRIK